MSRSSRAQRSFGVVAFGLLPILLVAPQRTDGVVTGPSVTSAVDEVAPDGTTMLRIERFKSPWVTISVCGNNGVRGDADCAMRTSASKETYTDGGPLLYQITVPAPPMDCPCVIRVAGSDPAEKALTPIIITGHPVGPIVEPPDAGDLMRVSIAADPAPDGLMEAVRAQLGGPVRYRVTVRVVNTSNLDLRSIQVTGAATRDAGKQTLVSLDLDDPGQLRVGQTWQQTVDAVIPAPLFETVSWRVNASGAGPSKSAEVDTKNRPLALIILVALIVLDLAYLLQRNIARRRAARDAEARQGNTAPQDAPDEELALV